MSVPTNLIPTKITGLPEYTGTSQAGYFPYVLDGTSYKVQFSSVASAGEVPPSRTLTAGTGLVGGGDLSANRVFAIANGGVGAQQLDTTGVVAGVYGNASNIPTVTVDANGRVTSVTTSPVVATGYVPESRTITAGAGLIGGGSLANNITLSLNISSATPQALGNATAGVSTAAARGDHVHPAVNLSDTNETQGALPLGRGGTGDALSPVAGAVVYSTGTKFALTNPGIPGQVLVSGGTDEPQWLTVAGLGTVTSVNASGGSTGMTFTGGPITTAGTLTLGGTLAVANGGTGATTASGARTNLGAAASGANSDITSLSGITGGISTADFVAFDTTNVTPPTTGQLAWNVDDGTLDVGLLNNVVLQVGQEQMFYAKNTSGGTIPIGTPVMFTGAIGASGKITFGLAVANGSVPAEYMMGVTAQNIANNGFGYVTTFGLVRGFNTSGAPYGETWADGDLLYFSPSTPGGWTKVEPQAPNIHVPVAVVVNAATGGSGSIFVRMIQSERLGELQDVEINGGGPAAGQVLIYDASQSRWENNTLTAGSNVTITNGNGSITIAATEQFTGTVTSVAASGGTTGLTFSGSPITSAGTLTLGGTLAIGSGGTGATTAGGARTALGAAGSGANTDITSIALTSGTILNSPTSGTDIVNKAYADSIASGINFHQSVRLATVAPLPANTYNNGTGGVGATLTANANGALSIDGVAVVAGNRVLVKNEAAQANNGVYVVTQTGSGSTPYILTRATDFDSAGAGVDQIDAGDFFLVTAGSTLTNTSWVQQTPLPITVGTTAIVFSQFGAPVLYSAGTGLTLAGTVFSITNTGVTASTYGSASQVPVIAVNAQGQITSASNTSISIAASQVTSGSLAVARGGTALSTTPTNGQLLIGNGTGYSLSTLSAGTGISVSNGAGSVTVTNTAPDQIVTITGGGATVVTGTYPNFTISSTTGTGTVTSVDVSGGTTGLSFTGGPITSSGIITMGGTLAVANGGTGVTTSTGTGSVVLNTSPTLVTPTLGAASATSIATALGAVGTPSYTFTGDLNTGMWSPAADTIAFSTAGSERLRVDSSGNLGINATPQAWGANFKGIEGYGASTFFLSGNSVNGITTVGNSYQNGTNWVYTTTGAAARYQVGITAAPHIWSYAASGTAGATVTWSEAMRIDNSGNVGIGTSAPVDRLQVEGNLYFGTSNRVVYTGGAGNLTLQTNTGVLAFNTGGSVERMRIDNAGQVGIGGVASNGTTLRIGKNLTGAVNSLGVYNNQAIQSDVTTSAQLFSTFPSTAAAAFTLGSLTHFSASQGTIGATSAVTNQYGFLAQSTLTGATNNYGFFSNIASGTGRWNFYAAGTALNYFEGNVGIGTTAPAQRLHVATTAAPSGTTQSFLRATADVGFGADFGGGIIQGVGPIATISTVSSGTATERMRIDSSGNVGIGTTNPAGYRLRVVGSSGSAQFRAGTDTNGYFEINAFDSAPVYCVVAGSNATAGVFGTQANIPTILFTNNTERMRLDTSGNVGIGTSSPGTRLDVAGGSIRVGNTHAMTFRNAAGTGTATFTLQSDDNFVVYNAAGTPISSFTQGATNIAVYGSNGSNRMIVDSINNATSWNVNGSERARINSSGEFLVGTTSGGRTVCVNAADNWIRQSNPSRSWLIGPSTGTSYMLWDETGGGARFTVDTSGNWFGNNAIILGSGFNNDNRIEVGQGRTGNNFAYIDLIGDTTYTDYGLRLLRGNSGPNATSELNHRGTGPLSINVQDAGVLVFSTSNTERFRITSTGAITSSDLADAVGYKGIPQNARTAAYTLALSDIGRHISITTGGVTIPANGTVAFPIGSAVTIYNNSASNQTISITTDTLRLAGTATTGSRTLAQRGICTCVKVAATEWVISGAGLT